MTSAFSPLRTPPDDSPRRAQAPLTPSSSMAAMKLEAAREPHVRPDDFYTTMLKDDGQMARVKEKLLFDKRRMEALAEVAGCALDALRVCLAELHALLLDSGRHPVPPW